MISLCMIVKDEEKLLPGCLDSVKEFVHEICIVDTGSTDRTIEIAQSYGAKVIESPWRDDFSFVRNESLCMATKPWIFVLDADERLTPESGPILRELGQKEPGELPIFVTIKSEIKGITGPETMSHILPRLFPNNSRIRYVNAMHEALVLDGKSFTGPLAPIEILHQGYTEDIVRQRDKITRNLALLRKELERRPDDPYAWYNFGFLTTQIPDLRDEGIAAFEKMLAFGTSEAWITVGAHILADAYMSHKHDPLSALRVIQTAESRRPPDVQLWFTRGRALTALKRYDDARKVFFELIAREAELRPRAIVNDDEIFGWKIRFNIAVTYLVENRLLESVPFFAQALACKPDAVFILQQYVKVLEAIVAQAVEPELKLTAEPERPPLKEPYIIQVPA